MVLTDEQLTRFLSLSPDDQVAFFLSTAGSVQRGMGAPSQTTIRRTRAYVNKAYAIPAYCNGGYPSVADVPPKDAPTD